MTSAFRRIFVLYDAAIRWIAILGATILFLSTFVVFADVVLRNAGTRGIIWQVEGVEYALFVSTFLLAPWVMAQGGHTRIDILLQHLSENGQRLVARVTSLLAAALCIGIAYYAAVESVSSFRRGVLIIKTLVVPEWMPIAIFAVSFALLSIEFMLRLTNYRSGQEAVSI